MAASWTSVKRALRFSPLRTRSPNEDPNQCVPLHQRSQPRSHPSWPLPPSAVRAPEASPLHPLRFPGPPDASRYADAAASSSIARHARLQDQTAAPQLALERLEIGSGHLHQDWAPLLAWVPSAGRTLWRMLETSFAASLYLGHGVHQGQIELRAIHRVLEWPASRHYLQSAVQVFIPPSQVYYKTLTVSIL